MKGRPILLSSALIANVFLSGACPQPQPPTCEKQRPVQIRGLDPAENATVIDPKVTIGATLDFLIGPRPTYPPLELIVDGINVTKQSQYQLTGDIPVSNGGIGIERKPLSPGKHTAEVRFTNDQNKRVSYAWGFYVSPKSLVSPSTMSQSIPQTKKPPSPPVKTPNTTPSQVPNCEKQRPIQIEYLLPGENATIVNSNTVEVGLNFLPEPHPVVARSLRLIIDGVDLTRQSRFIAAKDSLTQPDDFLFKPSKPFSPGKHTAEVHFTDNQNKQYSYTWNFYVSAQ
jgi:hypothetical protein